MRQRNRPVDATLNDAAILAARNSPMSGEMSSPSPCTHSMFVIPAATAWRSASAGICSSASTPTATSK